MRLFKPPSVSLPLIHLITLTATWGGSGLFRYAPGTAGSLAALPFAWLMHSLSGAVGLFAVAVALFVFGCQVSSLYMQYGDGQHDPSEIVIDEVAGQCLLLSLMPLSLLSYAVGFCLFRLFDIFKPWPISWCDRRVKGGFGVMLDDALAALYPVFLLALLEVMHQKTGMGASASDVMAWLE